MATDQEIARAKQLDAAKVSIYSRETYKATKLTDQKAQNTVNQIPRTLAFLPKALLVPILRIYVTAKEYVLNTPPAQVIPMQVVGGMGVIFLAWRVGRWEPFMRKWFLHRPVIFAGGARREWANCVTMFTSIVSLNSRCPKQQSQGVHERERALKSFFGMCWPARHATTGIMLYRLAQYTDHQISHQSFAHFFFNSFALTSFGAAAYTYLSMPTPSDFPMPSSTHAPHFLAFLLMGGLFSSLSSHLWTNLVRLPKLLRTLSSPARLSSAQALASHQAILPSLGASGAIYSALTVTACAFPDSNVGIILIPFVSFPIWLGVGGMVTLDLIGLIRGWQ